MKLQALRKSMKGLGTDDTALIRMVVTRAEVDMHYIVSEYRKRYKKTLYNAVIWTIAWGVSMP